MLEHFARIQEETGSEILLLLMYHAQAHTGKSSSHRKLIEIIEIPAKFSTSLILNESVKLLIFTIKDLAPSRSISKAKLNH